MADAQRGDRAALEALLRRHHDRVAALCTRLCGPSDAPDATQEALLAVVRGLRRFDGHAAFTTWLYRVTTNACLDELRRRRRRPLPGLEEERPLDGGAVAADPAGAVAARVDVDAALARLAPEFRAAVVLRDLCGLDYAEIAEVLDIPAGTVRSRISRGRAILVERLGRGDEPGNPTAPPERQTTDG